MKKLLAFLICLVLIANINAQNITPQQYIDLYKDIAIREMKRMGVPAAITLAQGILETESGNSVLVKKSNNHFGIKCKNSWTAGGVTHDDDAKGECFRQYNTAEDSYRDHSNFLRGSERYGFLFNIEASDYKGWAYGLKKAGYATNPAYPQILIKNIEQYNLNQYTLAGIADVPKYDKTKYKDDEEVITEADKNAMAAVYTSSSAAASTFPSGVFRVDGKKVILAKQGTSLLKIAEEQDIRLIKLLEYNNLKEDGLVKADQIIYLEQKPADAQVAVITQPTPAAVMPALNNKKHIVQPKEGLYAISKKYNTTVQQIRDWNSLGSDELRIGQELIVAQ